jgi:L-alanine-DL-glutamate epimerase-like enolase superfamily enzyme
MEIKEIRIHFVTLPFVGDFSHSLNKGDFSKNAVVEVIAEEGGVVGYGESAPRSYVTGESQESIPGSVDFFLKLGSFPWSLHGESEIWDFVDRLPDHSEHNAALCGLELAMLDALGKSQGRSIMDYLPKAFFSHNVFYGAILPLDDTKRIEKMSRVIRDLEIRPVKVKMGRDLKANQRILQTVSSVLKKDCHLKVDVNGAWDREAALGHLRLLTDFGVKVVEQPLAPGDREIVFVSQRLKGGETKIMADESACSLHEVKALVEEGHYNMINVRLSKCGGFRRSLRIIEFLRDREVPYQVACQLGESGILSAAGRALSLHCKDALYHDGSYDQFLLKENVTKQNVSFGQKGEAGPLGGVGLGVEVNRPTLRRLSFGVSPVLFRRSRSPSLAQPPGRLGTDCRTLA